MRVHADWRLPRAMRTRDATTVGERKHPTKEDVGRRAGDKEVREVSFYRRQGAPDAVLHDDEESHADG